LFLLAFAAHNFFVSPPIDPSRALDQLEKLAQNRRHLGFVFAHVDGPCNVR
jgi:hypothetical protein